VGSEKGHRRNLDQRLHNSGIEASTEPLVAWHQLRQIEGGRATVIDLYRLVSGPRGLQPHELPLEERLELARSAMPFVWPGFTLTAGSERYDPIRVVDYDPSWPARFQGWRKRLSRELGQAAVRIEHVGSTAVADLAAKAVVDIQVSVVDITDEDSYVRSVERSGLQLRSRDGLHRYFRPPIAAPRDVHVHVCNAGSNWEREHLLFRDYLRIDQSARKAYAQTKLAAAQVWADDGWAYTDAKSEVILDILELAEQWAATCGWTP
jgi:GrpB-like predicted nucleotidyltransferase (UPF0157 family)